MRESWIYQIMRLNQIHRRTKPTLWFHTGSCRNPATGCGCPKMSSRGGRELAGFRLLWWLWIPVYCIFRLFVCFWGTETEPMSCLAVLFWSSARHPMPQCGADRQTDRRKHTKQQTSYPTFLHYISCECQSTVAETIWCGVLSLTTGSMSSLPDKHQNNHCTCLDLWHS